MEKAFTELLNGVNAALETYSNVHRGSGHHSIVTTHLFEEARSMVLDYLGLNKGKYVVIFCTPRRAHLLTAQLDPASYQIVSSKDLGLSLGVRALAVKRNAFPKGIRFQAGGGTARLASGDWVIWAREPDRYEAGTPAIINIIAFARALQLVRHFRFSSFQEISAEKHTTAEILYHDELEKYSGEELLEELRKTLIGRDFLVPTVDGPKPFINLDNAASTPTFMPMWTAASRALCLPVPTQQEIIEEVKSVCANFLHASSSDYDMVFTSNTTESINLVAESTGNESLEDLEPVVVNTLLEHNSNDLPWRMIPGFSLVRLPIDENGIVDLNELETILCEYNHDHKHGKKRITLVSVSGASNVLGVYNDLAAISRIVHQYDVRLLVDAAQMVAHRKVDTEGCGIDYLAFSAHKVYAPFGCGVLLARKGLLRFSPKEQEAIRSSGEENVAGIAALGKALFLLQRIGMDVIQKEEQALTSRALQGLSKIPGLQVYGIKDPGSPEFAQKGGVIVFSVKGILSDRVAKELAKLAGIGIRYGCHCSHILIKHLLGVGPSLQRFQFLIVTLFPRMALPGLARVSLGIENSQQDIDTLIQALEMIARKSPRPRKDIKQPMKDFVRAANHKVFNQDFEVLKP